MRFKEILKIKESSMSFLIDFWEYVELSTSMTYRLPSANNVSRLKSSLLSSVSVSDEHHTLPKISFRRDIRNVIQKSQYREFNQPTEQPLPDEEYKILKLMRLARKASFAQQITKFQFELNITPLMQRLFIMGTSCPMDFKNDEIYEKDLTGKTPLHYAAAGGVNFNSNVFKLKLQSKLIGIQDNNGLTALMIAAELGHVDQIPFLLTEAGLKDSKNRTALMLAQKANQQKAVNLLWDLEKKLRIAEPINNSVCDPQ